MQRKKRSESWTNKEVRQMLHIMKKSHFAKLLDNTTETNARVYESLSKEMAKHNVHRTARQIRNKFSYLWLDYVKLEKTKDYRRASRHTNKHFDLLSSIFERHTEKNDPRSTNGESAHDADALSSDETKPQAIEVFDDSDEEMADDSTLNDTTDIEEESDESDVNDGSYSEEHIEQTAITDISTHTDKSCHGYEKVVASFTKDWKNSQRALIEDLKRQDLRDLRTISKQFKYQETTLRKSRLELEKTLEKDRTELKLLLDTFLKAKDSVVNHAQTNGIETDLKVKEEVEKTD